VDDEVAIRSLIQTSLEELGYTVLSAENGTQAVELFERSRDQIVLVLLDLVMPVMDGPDTATRLHELNPEIPIIVISGISDEDALGRFGRVRLAGFVPKPFAPDQLAQAVALVRRGPQSGVSWVGKDRRQTEHPDFTGPNRRGSMV
jgi:two-component system cell cycle sensor histidine kinase/response regulator CckA